MVQSRMWTWVARVFGGVQVHRKRFDTARAGLACGRSFRTSVFLLQATAHSSALQHQPPNDHNHGHQVSFSTQIQHEASTDPGRYLILLSRQGKVVSRRQEPCTSCAS